ncbi:DETOXIFICATION 14 protein [Nymphaea thermarum]|nr:DETOXIFICATION 14 protein [Nymphaea thermarum]
MDNRVPTSLEISHGGAQNGSAGGGEPVLKSRMSRLSSRTVEEFKKLGYIAGPAILTSIFQFSIGLVTVAFVGHLGKVELAAVTIASNVIEGFAFGVLLGMGSALETLCGQAFGAGQFDMLGVYMQRSWVITLVTALMISPLYIFTSPLLKALHQSHDIAEMAGKYSIWVIPQLFAYAFNFPMQKFYQSQSRVIVITVIAGTGLGLHALLNWIFLSKLHYGIVGAAVIGNITWWLINAAQMIYLLSGKFPDAWTGFSWKAFHSLGSFIRLSLASAVILELWYFTAVLILVGLLKNPELAVDAISICMNLEMWTLMIALGFNAAISVRISNELGALRPKAAKFSVKVATLSSLSIGVVFMVVVVSTKQLFPRIFTSEADVIKETAKLANLLSLTMVLNSVQPVLSGVAVGAGWQSLVAYINIGCYYLFGLPVGALLGFKFKFGVMGIWSGMLAGCLLQTVILVTITIRTNWQKEALRAEEHIRTWGGSAQPQGEAAS